MNETPIKDKELACSLNYEAEYHLLMEEFENVKTERAFLQEELKAAERDLRWLNGFKSAVDTIFGKQNICE